MPPETMEFDRVGSLRRGQLNSADSSDSIDSGVGGDATSTDGVHQPQIRGRAATFDVYKIRTRVGSKVSQITKYTQEVLANKPQQRLKSKSSSPSVKRLLSSRRKMLSSPQFFRAPHQSSSAEATQILESTSVPSSPDSIAVLENGDIKSSQTKEEGGGREDVDSGVTPVKNRTPRSADSSPQVSPKMSHSNKIKEHMVKRAK